MSRAALVAALAVLLLVPATAPAQEHVVYSSLPLHGRDAPTARAIVRGIEAALDRAGRPVRHVSLDDSSRRYGSWLPERVAANARRAGRDVRALAYIGDFNSGASSIAIPVLNERDLLQVSPSSTYAGLTRGGPGSFAGEPGKYYPTGKRTFGRVIPNDRVQARAGGVVLRDAGVERVLVVHDGEVYGRGLARLTARAARARGIRVVGVRRLRQDLDNSRALARVARRLRADGMFYGGVYPNGATRLWRAFARMRRVRLFGGDGLFASEFTRAIPRSAARRTRILALPMAPEAYPREAQELLDALGPGTDVYALYGYEAMSVVLDAIARGGATREGVRDAFFATRDRESILGRYSIDSRGDTTLTQYGVYRVADGALAWERAVDAAAP